MCQNKSIIHLVMAAYDVKVSFDKGEESRNDQSPPGSHLGDCGEYSLCEGIWLGGGHGDDHQEHQTVRDKK